MNRAKVVKSRPRACFSAGIEVGFMMHIQVRILAGTAKPQDFPGFYRGIAWVTKREQTIVFAYVLTVAIFSSSFPRRLRIQKRTLRRNAPPFFDWQPFGWRERTGFPPSRAFAGMTGGRKML
jgi:hypothetical protein